MVPVTGPSAPLPRLRAGEPEADKTGRSTRRPSCPGHQRPVRRADPRRVRPEGSHILSLSLVGARTYSPAAILGNLTAGAAARRLADPGDLRRAVGLGLVRRRSPAWVSPWRARRGLAAQAVPALVRAGAVPRRVKSRIRGRGRILTADNSGDPARLGWRTFPLCQLCRCARSTPAISPPPGRLLRRGIGPIASAALCCRRATSTSWRLLRRSRRPSRCQTPPARWPCRARTSPASCWAPPRPARYGAAMSGSMRPDRRPRSRS